MDLHAVFDTLITRAHLEDLAGTIVFARGEAYFESGAVARLRITADRIRANVSGSETWRVELRDVGELDVDCNCPHSADGNVCKHVVAVGLAWLGEQAAELREGKAAGKKLRRDPRQDIEQFLAAQPVQTLIDQLMDCAQRDDRLYQSLLLKAERARGGSGDVAAAFHRAIEDATRINGFVDWREAASLAGDLDQLLISLRELLQPDTADVLVELAEYAIERLENAMERIDDSGGEIGGIVSDLGELHHTACRMAKPEPTALAERLFMLQTTLPFGICSFDAESYGKMLGRSGLARYRELAESEWRKLKLLTDKDRHDTRRSTLTSMMESLAKASGDIDELVAIKAQNLSSAWRYLGIAEIWAQAKQPDKALEWAERGLAAFPERTDNRLRDFLVGIYLKHKRHDEALQLTWIQFEEQPSLERFRKLHDVTVTLKCWPQQRQRALAELADAVPRRRSDPYHYSAATGRTLRLSIALWENDLEAAWETVKSGGCDHRLLIELADKLASVRPHDAISLYQAVVPSIVEQTNNAAYNEAIKLIRKIGSLLKAQKQSATFGNYLTELRVRFKPKRNFIKLLDGVIRTIT